MPKALCLIKKHAVKLLLAAFILTLLPMLAVALFNRPCGDDLYYSARVHDALTASGSVFAALQAAFATVAHTYVTWQGTYSAIFLMSLQPGIFGGRFYAIGAVVIILSLTAAAFKLANTLFCCLLGQPRRSAVLFAIGILFCMLQYLPSAVEGFYWYNGAVYYTFTFALLLLYFDALLLTLQGKDRHPALRITAAILLGAFIGGCNFSAALLAVLEGALLLVYGIYRQRNCRQHKIPWRLLPPQLVLLAGFFVSIVAPGNALRADKLLGMDATLSILCSLFIGAQSIFSWASLTNIALFLLLLPLLNRAAKSCRWKFSHPFLALLGAFLLYAAQNAPPFYAMRNPGPVRLRDAVYYSFYWLVAFCLFYLCGWARRHTTIPMKIAALRSRLGARRQAMKVPLFALTGAVFVLCVLSPASLASSTSCQCARALLNGSAARYSAAIDARLTVYNDPQITDARVPLLKEKPPVLFEDDIKPDPKAEVNRQVSIYYHKHSIQGVK